jgi:hypothetical protein
MFNCLQQRFAVHDHSPILYPKNYAHQVSWLNPHTALSQHLHSTVIRGMTPPNYTMDRHLVNLRTTIIGLDELSIYRRITTEHRQISLERSLVFGHNDEFPRFPLLFGGRRTCPSIQSQTCKRNVRPLFYGVISCEPCESPRLYESYRSHVSAHICIPGVCPIHVARPRGESVGLSCHDVRVRFELSGWYGRIVRRFGVMAIFKPMETLTDSISICGWSTDR